MNVQELIDELRHCPSTAVVIIAVDYRKDKANNVEITDGGSKIVIGN